jgi:hypothetical protein
MVRLGIVLLQLAVLLAGAFLVTAVLLPSMLLAQNMPGRAAAAATLAQATLSLAVGSLVVQFLGQMMCMAVPRNTECRGLAIVSAFVLFIGLVCLGVGAVLLHLPVPAREGTWILLAGTALGVLAQVPFVFFLRATARFFERHSLANWLAAYLAGYLQFVVASVALALSQIRVPPVQVGQETSIESMMVTLVYVGVGLLLHLALFCLLAATRGAIGRGVKQLYGTGS